MKKDILTFVAECDVCQRHKGETVKAPGTLQPLPISTSIWTEVSMDFITGLPKSGNKSVIMVVVDRLLKYAHFYALPHPFTPTLVVQSFMDQIFKLHGMPTSIVSDRDPIFTSNFWQELFRLQGTQLKLITSYHPQTDGQTEAVNKCMETYLRCFTSEKQHLWVQWLPLAKWWYNTNYHATTKMTPYEAVYGQIPPSPTSYIKVDQRIQTSLPKLGEEGSIWLQPEQVLDTRERPLRGCVIREVLVKWKDTYLEDTTWEPATILQQFPQLQP
eukprot:PITA_36585